MHSQLDLIRYRVEGYFELVHAAVFHRVVKGFLQNTEEAQRDVIRKVFAQAVTAKINLDVLPLGKLSAKAGSGRFESEVFELRRMQAVRKSLDVILQLGNLFAGLVEASAGFLFRERKTLVLMFSDSLRPSPGVD